MSAERRMAGFSLVEVIVALVIVSVGSAGFAALFASGQVASHAALERQRASELALELIDRLRTLPYEQLGFAAKDPLGSVWSAHCPACAARVVQLPASELDSEPADSGPDPRRSVWDPPASVPSQAGLTAYTYIYYNDQRERTYKLVTVVVNTLRATVAVPDIPGLSAIATVR